MQQTSTVNAEQSQTQQHRNVSSDLSNNGAEQPVRTQQVQAREGSRCWGPNQALQKAEASANAPCCHAAVVHRTTAAAHGAEK